MYILILDVINLFFFGHGVVIYYVQTLSGYIKGKHDLIFWIQNI